MTSALARKSGPTRHVYDVIVVGAQLSAALTAALCAKRGLQVLWAEHDVVDGSYASSGWQFPIAPTVFPKLAEASALDAVLTELGMHASVQRSLKPIDVQLLAPKQWLTLGAGRVADCKRLGVPGEPFDQTLERTHRASTASDAFFQAGHELPASWFWPRFKLRRAIKAARGLDEVSGLASLPAPFSLLSSLGALTHSSADASPLNETRAMARALMEPHAFPGGREGLKTALAERARELGADVVGPDSPVQSIVFEGSKPAGVRLAKGDTTYRAGFVCAGCDVDTLVSLVPDERKGKLQKFGSPLSAARALFTHHVIVPAKAMPRGLGELAVLPADDTELGAVIVQVAAAKKTNGAESAERLLSLTAPAPTALHRGGEPAVKAFAERLWAVFTQAFPFTRAQAAFESSVWSDCEPVAAGQVEPWPLFSLPANLLGVEGLPVKSPFTRLLLTNRQVLPGLGLEGETLAVKQAVAVIEAALKKNDPLKARKSA